MKTLTDWAALQTKVANKWHCIALYCIAYWYFEVRSNIQMSLDCYLFCPNLFDRHSNVWHLIDPLERHTNSSKQWLIPNCATHHDYVALKIASIFYLRKQLFLNANSFQNTPTPPLSGPNLEYCSSVWYLIKKAVFTKKGT